MAPEASDNNRHFVIKIGQSLSKRYDENIDAVRAVESLAPSEYNTHAIDLSVCDCGSQ
jgi:hypothetical protein